MKKIVAKKEEQPSPQEKHEETPVEFLASLASVLVTGLFIITFIIQAFEIPSSSMEDTLLIGDHVFVNRVQFAPPTGWLGRLLPYREVRRDEIAVFMSPVEPLYLVKRIIGVPGDRIHLKNGEVYRNGQLLVQPFVRHKQPEALGSEYRDNFPAVPPSEYYSVKPNWILEMPQHIQNGEIVVPPGYYWAMGDNRDVSLDSRYWGFVPRENFIGRPLFIYWSFETPDGQWQRREWTDRLQFLAHVVIHFFDETRWRRTLQGVR